MGEIVSWRGARFDPRTRDMLVELASLVDGYVQPSQGSYSTSDPDSGGTHAGGGAVDIRCSNLTDAQETEVVLWGRRIGFAMWLRQASKSWSKHIHGIAIGCPDLSPQARDQVEDYRNGRNGLVGNGPDDGPDVPFTTWEQYQEERDVVTEAEFNRFRTIAREEANRAFAAKANITAWTESLLPPPGARSREGLIGYAAALAYDGRQRTARLAAVVDQIVDAVAEIPGVDADALAAKVSAAMASDVADELGERLQS